MSNLNQSPHALPANTSPVLRDYSDGGDVLLIVFSGLRRTPHEVPGFSFRGVAKDLPVNKLYLRDLTKTWFLRGLPGVAEGIDRTAAFLRDEAAKLGARHVVMTGYSLGGFAAILYGALVDAAEVHVFSPQTFVSLRKRLLHRDHRWNRYVLPLPLRTPARYRDLVPMLKRNNGPTRYHIHFAQDSPLDALHARRIEHLPNVTLHPHPEGRHRLVTVLRESGALLTILKRAVSGVKSR